MAVLYTHTRGEWVADIGVGQVYAVNENGESVAVAIVYGTYDDPSECQANACLIAAAPKLLAACQAQQELIEILYAEAMPNLRGRLDVIEQVSSVMRQTRAAIAATGQGEVGA